MGFSLFFLETLSPHVFLKGLFFCLKDHSITETQRYFMLLFEQSRYLKKRRKKAIVQALTLTKYLLTLLFPTG